MTLANEFEHFVKAACSGLWVVSDAFDDAIMELDRRCREITAQGEADPDAKIGTWTLRVWDECTKLQRVDTDKVCRPVEKGPENLMVFLAELVQRMHTNTPDSFDASIYVLRGVGQRELRSPAICASLLTCMQLGRRCGICIVFLNAIPPAAVMDMPEELRRQLVVVEHPLPDREQLKSIAESTSSDPEVVPEGDEMESVIDAASGLTHAGAELAFAVSIIREGAIKPSVVWEQKASMLKQSAALTMHQGEETFDNIGGMHGLKDFCKRIMSNRHTDPLRMPRGVLLMGVPGSGKCLGRGTPVLRFDGSIAPVEAIEEGDRLMGPDSQPRTVLKLVRGHGELFRVTPVKGDPYVVNADHTLSLKKTGTEEIVNVTVREYLTKWADTPAARERLKGWRSRADWTAVGVPIDPYVFGVWLGDGSNYKPQITTPDKEVVLSLKNYATECGLICHRVEDRGKAGTYAIVSQLGSGGRAQNSFLRHLRDMQVMGHKHIPDCYKVNERSSRLELLAGLLDADGHYCAGCFEISTKYNELAADILFLARSLGFAAYASYGWKADAATGGGGYYHRISLSGELDAIPTRVARKKADPRKQIKDVLKTGIEVESIGEGDYFGFELSGDRLFLLGDFTVTHNSAFAKALGNETGRKTIALDVGALRGSLQGETEERTRKALQIVDAMGTSILFVDEIEKAFAGSESSGRTDGGTGQRVLAKWLSWMNDRTSDTFFIGTANDIESLPAAFVRAERFDAVFFLDLPDDAEKRVIWEMYLKLFELEADLEKCLQLSGQWTGAEIRSCCRLAAIMDCSIDEAREKVIPVARTANEQLLSLREWANKRCLCAKTGKMFYKAALDSSNSSLKEASRANANPSRRRLKKPAAGGGM